MDNSRYNRSYWPALVIGTAICIYILASVQRLSPPVIALEIMGDLGLTPDNMSLMFAMTMAAYAFMQPISGFCADRFGPRRCLLVSALLMGAGSILFSQAQGLMMGLGTRTFMGLAAGITILSCMKLAIHWFKPERFGLVNSLVIASAALANFAVGRPLAISVDAIGWRSSFFWLGLAGLGLALLTFLLIQDRPPQDDSPGQQEALRNQEKLSFFKSVSMIASLPQFWLLGLLYSMTDMPYAILTGLWIGPYLMEVHGQSEASVGNMLSVSAFGFLIGPTLWMLLASYWKSLSKVVLLAICANILIGIFMVFGPADMNVPFLYFFTIVAPVGGQIAGIMFILAKNLVPPNLSASAMGLMNTFPFIFGAAMQQIIGSILTRTELQGGLPPRDCYAAAFKPYLVYITLGLFLALWQLRLEKREKASSAAKEA